MWGWDTLMDMILEIIEGYIFPAPGSTGSPFQA